MNYILENEGDEMVKWVPFAQMPYKFKTFTFEEMVENGQIELDKDRKMLYVEMSEHEEGQAYKEGLRSGDILLEINGDKVYGPLDLLYVAIHSLP